MAVTLARPAPGRRAGTTPELLLAALAIAVVFAAALILPMPFWQARPAGPPAAAAASTSTGIGWPGVVLGLGFALVLCLPLRPYSLALGVAECVSPRLVLGLTGLLALTALLIFPGFGSDLFVYLDYERLWVVYGANPLLAAPALHPEDWAFPFTWIPAQPSPYGPLWPLLTWAIVRLAGDDLWASIIGYKLLALASYVACGALVWASTAPAQRQRALVLFAWSPLVLFETLGKAHNDGLLAVAALTAVWIARRDQPALGLLAATAGALIKVSGLAVVLGLAAWLVHQRRWRDLAAGTAASAGLTVVLYAPFWVGPESLLPILVQTSRVVWSPGSLLIAASGWLGSGAVEAIARPLVVVAPVETLVRVLLVVTFGAACAVLACRRRPFPVLAAGLLLATLLLLTTAFFAHYLVPVIALAALAGDRHLDR
ncbi:MAG TPA: glycosyltransferase 87 family protein, partial [Chloroflexota bacterium]|nr:glycosyltransferase 87 family protein [Chloroflexota bacterium]